MTEWTYALNELQELLGIICPKWFEAFEADPLVQESHCHRCRTVLYPNENPLGTNLGDEI